MGVGCFDTKGKKYKEDIAAISNRDIAGEEETPGHHHGLTGFACGYGFGIDGNDINEVMAKHRQAQKMEEECQKWERLLEKCAQISKIYKQHDIDSCIVLLVEVETLYKSIDFSLVQDVSSSKKEEIDSLVSEMRSEYEQMLSFVGQMQKSNWQAQGQQDGIKMSTRRQGDTVGTLMQKVIELPVQIFLTVLSQIDYYTDLIKQVKLSREQKFIARNHKIGYCAYDLPILSVREVFFQALGYNRLKHNNTIFMYSRSIHNRPDICRRLDYAPPLHSEYVQIDYKYLMVRYVPIGENRGVATIAVNIDMKLDFVPMGVLEWICKKFCRDFFKIVVEASDKFKGSKWEEKVKRNPESYQFFRRIVANHLTAK